MKFDIIIPTWNNLKYLKLAIESIKKYSLYNHSIYVHVNEGTDGTIEWLKENGIKFTYFSINRGVCEGTNMAAKLGNNEYVVYFNDDMVTLPEWDKELKIFRDTLKMKKFILCCTPIEPTGNNSNCIIRNYGLDIEFFNETQLLADLKEMRLLKPNLVSTWCPMVIPRNLWEEVGGFSIEYEPGFGSDPDICKKMYNNGCRDFVGVGRSLIYHFQTKTTSRVFKNNSRDIFLRKHGVDLDDFVKNILMRGMVYVNKQ
jgi:glycosyltransferase involved in cell wall biosynthesis